MAWYFKRATSLEEFMSSRILMAPKRRFWLCRAEGGRYTNHFKKFDTIALGHLDGLSAFRDFSSRKNASKVLIKHLKAKKFSKSKISNHVNQILHFIFDLEVGDLILTPGGSSLLVGRVTSAPTFKRKKLLLEAPVPVSNAAPVEMRHFLRRDVEWITSIPRVMLPHGLSKGITGHQSFFNLDNYEDQIYSTLCAFVYSEDSLRSNVLIRSKHEISTLHFSKLTNIFLKCEFLAKNWDSLGSIKSADQLEALFNNPESFELFSSRITAEFSSPGWTSNKTKFPLIRAGIFFVLLSCAIKGGTIELNSASFKANLNGVLSEKDVSYIIRSLPKIAKHIEKWLEKDSEGVAQKLELRLPENPNVIEKLEMGRKPVRVKKKQVKGVKKT
jgi:hypothetical protein